MERLLFALPVKNSGDSRGKFDLAMAMLVGEREVQRDEPVRMRRAAAYFGQFARERLDAHGAESGCFLIAVPPDSGFWLRRRIFFT